MSLDVEAIKELMNAGEIRAQFLADKDGEHLSEPFAVVPDGKNVVSLAFLVPPTRIKQRVDLLETSSFVDYVNRFKQPNTLIFAEVRESGASFKAVLDYHGPDNKPDYCNHSATLNMMTTPEWKAWLAINRQNKTQMDFATWLEDNLKLVVEPDSAHLLEMVQTLHAKRNARFNESSRLQTGAHSVSYEEDITVRSKVGSGSGELELPGTITAGISVFQGGQPYKVKARLKTTIEDRRLYLRIETVNINEIVRDSIMQAVEQIGKATGIIPLLGSV